MADKEKIKKLKKLADAMYYAAQYLTTDASRLHKAMDEYHQFIIHEWREEPVSEVWHYQKKEPINEIADKSRPIIVVYGNNSLNAGGKFRYYEDNSDAIWLSNSYEKWAFVEDLINLTHLVNKTSDQEEPVSEDLKEIAWNHADKKCHLDIAVFTSDEVKKEREKMQFTWQDLYDAVMFGAKWQKEQFEKNRLKHCDSITNEQAELEQGFIDQHLDKYQRMPTFLDAVEYGMRLQKEQMMAKAIDAKLLEGHLIRQKGVTHPLHAGDKVKVIVIKED